MSCAFPLSLAKGMVPCGKCQGCLRRRRKAWVARLLLEQNEHEQCAFVTLTYDDDHLPTVFYPEEDRWIPTLVKSHPQKWIRSVRKKGYSVRYFVTGEYGTKTLRPHYHAIIFGLGPGDIALFQETWKRGFVSAYEANPRTMAYTAKYCLKGSLDPEPVSPTFTPRGKRTNALDQEPKHEPMRIIEAPFRLFSRNPPLGGGFAKNIATSMTRTRMGKNVLHTPSADLSTVRMNRGIYPLDRTMKLKIKGELINEGVHPEAANAMFNTELPEVPYEQVAKAQVNHRKALRNRHRRHKL